MPSEPDFLNLPSNSLQRASNDASTKRDKLLSAAIELFAERGPDNVTVRDITSKAGTNLAAVNYYFESREHLLQMVFRNATEEVTRVIGSRLTAYEQLHGNEPYKLEPLLRALCEPLIQCLFAPPPLSNLAQIFVSCVILPPSSLSTAAFDQESIGLLFSRACSALSRAIPGWNDSQIAWGVYFLIGSLYTATRDRMKKYHYRQLTDGKCDTGNPREIVDQLVAFLERGFAGEARSSNSQ